MKHKFQNRQNNTRPNRPTHALVRWKSPCEHHATTAGQNNLMTVQFIGDGRTLAVRPGSRVPQRFTIARIERQKISHRVAGKRKTRVGSQYPCAGAFGTKFMAPTDFASLVVDRFQHALAPNP